jgi:FkbM family methyltransferase
MSSSFSTRVVGAIEGLIGRHGLWRLGRLIYRHARRDGDNSPEINGEYALHQKLSEWASRQDRPFKVVDVGSNIGYWSSHLLESCKRAGVKDVELWAFEPSDEIRCQLEKRMQSAPSDYRVHIHAKAVSDEPGRAAFDATPGISGVKHLLTQESIADGETPSVDVAVTTLVDFFKDENIDVVDFVKSDVEGFDLSVIRGALPLLSERRIGVFQFEYNHCWISTRSYLRDVFELAEGIPYRVCKVVPEGIDGYESWHVELETYFEVNYLLVRDDLLEDLDVRMGTFSESNTYAARR